MSDAAPTPSITPVTTNIGAVVDGVTLGPDLSGDTADWIQARLVEHKVLFFREQGHLDQAAQEGFGRLLGRPQAHPTVPSADGRFSLAIDSAHGQRADRWHADVTFIPNYPKLSILRATKLPPVGGDTLWADQTSAYDSLPVQLRDLADRLRAVHTNQFDYAVPRHDPNAEALSVYREQFQATQWRTEHPLVRVHPVSGKRTLVLGSFIDHITGLGQRESDLLLQLFQGHVERPEHVVRWRWSVGDVAIWDNRATQHRVVDDFADGTRTLARVTLEGEIPVGVDGRESELLTRVGNDIPQPQEIAA